MLLSLNNLLVADVMSKDYYLLNENDTFSKARSIIVKDYKKEIFVLNDVGKIQGIITIGDISKLSGYCYINEKTYLKDIIKGIMKREVISVSKNTSLLKCRDIMLENNVSRLPVIEKNQIVGVIRKTHVKDFLYVKLERILEMSNHIVNNIQEAVCAIDNKGKVILWNDNAENLYNISKETILGRRLDEFFPDAIDMKVLKTKQTFQNVYHTPKKDCHIVISASPIY